MGSRSTCDACNSGHGFGEQLLSLHRVSAAHLLLLREIAFCSISSIDSVHHHLLVKHMVSCMATADMFPPFVQCNMHGMAFNDIALAVCQKSEHLGCCKMTEEEGLEVKHEAGASSRRQERTAKSASPNCNRMPMLFMLLT